MRFVWSYRLLERDGARWKPLHRVWARDEQTALKATLLLRDVEAEEAGLTRYFDKRYWFATQLIGALPLEVFLERIDDEYALEALYADEAIVDYFEQGDYGVL